MNLAKNLRKYFRRRFWVTIKGGKFYEETFDYVNDCFVFSSNAK